MEQENKIISLQALSRYDSKIKTLLAKITDNISSLQEIVDDAGYKATRQLTWNWLASEWASTDSEGNTITYAKGTIVRCNGWVFKALADTTECPYETLSAEDGKPLVNSDYQLIISENVNEGNWAGISEEPQISMEEIVRRYEAFPSLTSRVSSLETEVSSLKSRLDAYDELLSGKTILVKS